MDFPVDKSEFNARAKASMREYLRSKTWVEKVESIERMRAAGEVARVGMNKVLAEKRRAAHTAALEGPRRNAESESTD